MHTFVWHDYETFGTDTRRDRPAQFAAIRQRVAFLEQDRYLAPDIEHATDLVRQGRLSPLFRALPGLPALWVEG